MTVQQTTGPVERTVITDVDIPFWRLVTIIIKWSLASIPALIIVWLILMVIGGIFAALFGTSWMMYRPSI